THRRDHAGNVETLGTRGRCRQADQGPQEPDPPTRGSLTTESVPTPKGNPTVIWKKSRLITWTADGGFRIVEVPDAELPFSLTSRDADPVYFPTIEQAKAVAELQNRLALAEEDNARLRSELDGRKPRSALH